MTPFEKKFGKNFLKEVVLKPGTYAFIGVDGKILYVGRAKNLRRRLSQYKNTRRLRRHRKMRSIVQEAVKLEWVECPTHLEACIREVKQIQEHRPRFNIEAKYSFLYPFVGLLKKENEVFFCLTTHPEEFPGFQFYGAYRSRRITGEAFFALYSLLKFIYNPISSKKTKRKVKHSYLLGLRKIPELEIKQLEDFLLGKNTVFLEGLTLRLLEKKSARVNKMAVQDHLDSIYKFFRWEARTLRRVMEKVGFGELFIPQHERDLLFLKARILD